MHAKHLLDPVLATWLTPLNISDPQLVADRAKEYYGDGYALGNTAAPASGGQGDQASQFKKQEIPYTSYARAMDEEPKPSISEEYSDIIDETGE